MYEEHRAEFYTGKTTDSLMPRSLSKILMKFPGLLTLGCGLSNEATCQRRGPLSQKYAGISWLYLHGTERAPSSLSSLTRALTPSCCLNSTLSKPPSSPTFKFTHVGNQDMWGWEGGSQTLSCSAHMPGPGVRNEVKGHRRRESQLPHTKKLKHNQMARYLSGTGRLCKTLSSPAVAQNFFSNSL